MEIGVTGRGLRSHFLADLAPHVLRQLNIHKVNGTVFVKIERGLEDPGVTVTLPGGKSWLILLKPGRPDEMAVSMCHELVHVRQLARGTLKHDGKRWRWCGRSWSRRTPYMKQPWELAAFREQDILFRRALEKL